MDNNKQLTNKKGVFFNMFEYYTKIGQDPYLVIPQTHLVQSIKDPEFLKFEAEFNRIQSKIKQQRQLIDNEIKCLEEADDERI
jgi:hypothetical protein